MVEYRFSYVIRDSHSGSSPKSAWQQLAFTDREVADLNLQPRESFRLKLLIDDRLVDLGSNYVHQNGHTTTIGSKGAAWIARQIAGAINRKMVFFLVGDEKRHIDPSSNRSDEQVFDDARIRRLGRLALAPTMPERVQELRDRYVRNPDVVAEVRLLAKGQCEACGAPAPFETSASEPFLEVHHCLPLRDGGEDIVDNAVAICPNCHREEHHGANPRLGRAYRRSRKHLRLRQ